MRLLFIFLLFQLTASLASASAVNCANSSSDAGAIQSAVNGGGTVTISGTCSMNTAISVNNSVTINGSGNPQLNFPGGDSFHVNANNITINGLTISNGEMWIPACCGSSTISNFTFTNNTFQNTSNQPDSIAAGILVNANISNNIFRNLWKGGYP